MSYIITAWQDGSEMTLRTRDPALILKKAGELIASGWKVSIAKTDTGETLTTAEVKARLDLGE